ncbi:hypothetical protein P8452_53920 [Trifolium repens]|nr:hypothetical protein P8452_53920 [Trifolium repens]
MSQLEDSQGDFSSLVAPMSDKLAVLDTWTGYTDNVVSIFVQLIFRENIIHKLLLLRAFGVRKRHMHTRRNGG